MSRSSVRWTRSKMRRCPTGSSSSFKDPATTQIYTLSLHDALPIFLAVTEEELVSSDFKGNSNSSIEVAGELELPLKRSEEHTSELQSRPHLVCRLLLEKKKQSIPHKAPLRKHVSGPLQAS